MKFRIFSLLSTLVFGLASPIQALVIEDPNQIATDLFATSAEQGVRFNDAKNCLIFSDFMAEYADQLSEQNFNRITFRLKRSNCEEPTPVVVAPTPIPIPIPEPTPEYTPLTSNLFRLANLGSFDSLSLRQSPPKGDRLLKIPKGTTGLPVSRCINVQGSSRPWCRLTYNGITGWAYSKYLLNELTGELPRVGYYPVPIVEPVVEPEPQPEPQPVVKEKYRVVGIKKNAKLKVRNRPLVGTVVGRISRKGRNISTSECVDVEGSRRPWCYVRHNGKIGWVNARNLRGQKTGNQPIADVSGTSATTPQVVPTPAPVNHTYKVVGVKAADWLNIRATPPKGQVIARLAPTATGLQITSCNAKSNSSYAWCLVRVGNIQGWAFGRYLASELDGRSPE